MKLMCLKCFEIYNLPSDYKHSNCPKNHCSGKIAEIDELMIPIVIKFREKGYTTAFCCQGHIFEANVLIDPYICFTRDSIQKIKEKNPTPPEGWVYYENGIYAEELDIEEYRNDQPRCDTNILMQNYKNKFEFIYKHMNSFYDWIENLK